MLNERKKQHESKTVGKRYTMIFIAVVVLLAQTLVVQTAVAQDSSPNLVTAIEQVAKQNIPAVVHVEVTERQEVANPLYPFRNNPFFKHFFNMPKKMPKKFERELMGLGSGIIIDSQGHILTNNHVVAGATKINVIMSNGQEFSDKEVKLVGTDPRTDLAVLKVTSKEPLPHATLGNSDEMQVGQWVVAIGQPRGLSESVTQGIISAKHRRGITNPESYQDFLQTDAAINPGNSGGPLLNLKGEVIGINAAIVSTSGGFEGIGFAIPSNMAVHVSKELIANGKVVRGWMGITTQDLTAELAQSFHVSRNAGALVADVVKGGPADKAGLERGDIITTYNGKHIPDGVTLSDKVANTPIGQEAKIVALRNGKSQDFTVKIANQEEEAKLLRVSLRDRLGVDVQPITSKEMDRYGLESEQGIEISWVDPKGPLGKEGFEVGDLILEINGQAIEGPAGFAAMIDAIPHHTKVVMLVVDHKSGQVGYVKVEIP